MWGFLCLSVRFHIESSWGHDLWHIGRKLLLPPHIIRDPTHGALLVTENLFLGIDELTTNLMCVYVNTF